MHAEQNIASGRIEVSSPQVIHETIDGEVIIINLSTGNYYSLKGSAAEIWDLIQQPSGVGGPDLVDMLATRFGATQGELESALQPFLTELAAEGLVSWSDDGSGAPPDANRQAASNGAGGGGQQTFAPPKLEKYTDMQDLVLLDPVHEVSDMGWPQRPADGGDNA